MPYRFDLKEIAYLNLVKDVETLRLEAELERAQAQIAALEAELARRPEPEPPGEELS